MIFEKSSLKKRSEQIHCSTSGNFLHQNTLGLRIKTVNTSGSQRKTEEESSQNNLFEKDCFQGDSETYYKRTISLKVI